MPEQVIVPQSSSPEHPEKRRPRRRMESAGAMANEGEVIFGIPSKTRVGNPKHPVALLYEVVCKRLPPVKIINYNEGDKQAVTICFVGNNITEGRGEPQESRDQAIKAMLNKLGHHSESGYTSENPHSPSDDSAANHEDECDDSSAEQRDETSTEGVEVKEDVVRPDAEKPRTGLSIYGKLLAAAKEKFPPVKYDVVRVLRSPTGPVFITRCAVKHMVTYGEAGGANAKQASKMAAAEAMLERMKTMAPLGSEEEDFHVINQPVVRATSEEHMASAKEVREAKITTNRVLPVLVTLMSRTDAFFQEYFAKAFYGGSFFDRVALGASYEVYFVFWHSGNVAPVDMVANETPKLRITRRDKYSRALFDMGFVNDQDALRPGKFLDWFAQTCRNGMRDYRVPKGVEVSNSITRGTFILKIKEGDGPEIEVKFKPCFAFPSLWSMPGCSIDLRPLKRASESEWYVVPERVTVPMLPRNANTSSNDEDDAEDGKKDTKKKRNTRRVTHWSFVAPAGERAVFHDTKMCKPILRLFLNLNAKLSWNLREDALKNMFMDEVLLHFDFDFWGMSDAASLLMMMLGRLESCLRAGFFPTIWESNPIKIAPGRARGILNSVGKLRDNLLVCYRRLVDLGPHSSPKKSGKNGSGASLVTDKRAIILDDVHALLTGEKRPVSEEVKIGSPGKKTGKKIRSPRKKTGLKNRSPAKKVSESANEDSEPGKKPRRVRKPRRSPKKGQEKKPADNEGEEEIAAENKEGEHVAENKGEEAVAETVEEDIVAETEGEKAAAENEGEETVAEKEGEEPVAGKEGEEAAAETKEQIEAV